MREDPIVAEIHRYRKENAEQHGHDLKRIYEAVKDFESKSGREVVHRRPRLLLSKTGS